MSDTKLCVFCKHFYFDGGSPGYSEMTPGWDAHMGCTFPAAKEMKKLSWQMENCDTREEFRERIKRASVCPNFVIDR